VITYWIPFYFPLKVAFLLWCMHPTYNGASVIYNNLLKGLVQKHMHHVDKVVSEVDPAKIIDAVKSAVTANPTPVVVATPATPATPTPVTPTIASPIAEESSS
jgi:hypothetical protein